MNTPIPNASAQSTSVPPILYGTAWKEDATEHLTRLALSEGFRGIDTANQRKHYFEAGVGAALQRAFEAGLVRRNELFVQSKFTHRAAQDERLPYAPAAPIEKQVHQSFASTREHLGLTFLDSFVLHGPSTRHGLAPEDLAAWRAMEELHDAGLVGALGVSNVSAEQLALLCSVARVAPRFVQNRCYARLGWDRTVREFCSLHAIRYQAFSLLTANRTELASEAVRALAARNGLTIAQLVFCFARHVGMLPLTGTTNAAHMRDDLRAVQQPLEQDAVRTLEQLSG